MDYNADRGLVVETMFAAMMPSSDPLVTIPSTMCVPATVQVAMLFAETVNRHAVRLAFSRRITSAAMVNCCSLVKHAAALLLLPRLTVAQ